jgi:hypothetical protein
MSIIDLAVKEYADLNWIKFLIVFVVLSVPFLVPLLRRIPVIYLELFNLLVFILSFPKYLSHNLASDFHFYPIIFSAFGLGYAIMALRKKKKRRVETGIAIFFTVIFLTLIGGLLYSQLAAIYK